MPDAVTKTRSNAVSTTNACKLCTPLGAALAFKGVERGVPFLHGSQGCATYMRRYVISHYREPVDIASSALGEKHAVYGGGPNLKQGILNVMKKYDPALVGVATTCLTETIGDDVPMILNEFEAEFGAGGEVGLDLPALVRVSTPSYSGTHTDGFHAAVLAMAEQLATDKAPPYGAVNLFPGMLSCADIRHLKDLVAAFGLAATVLPDYSETLDGPALEDYERIPSGGTPVAAIRAMGGAAASLELGRCLSPKTAGTSLRDRFGVPLFSTGMPTGLREMDRFLDALGEISGRPVPRQLEAERGRLVDAYVDGHKYVFGKRAVVYGEEDLVAGLVSMLAETGVHVVLAATGFVTRKGERGLAEAVARATDGLAAHDRAGPPEVAEGVDFHDIAERARELEPDLLVGHSKGYRYARDWDVPLVRVGFPIHDRFGGQRILHVGYAGTQALYDRIVNAILERNQAGSHVGYGYL